MKKTTVFLMFTMMMHVGLTQASQTLQEFVPSAMYMLRLAKKADELRTRDLRNCSVSELDIEIYNFYQNFTVPVSERAEKFNADRKFASETEKIQFLVNMSNYCTAYLKAAYQANPTFKIRVKICGSV